VVDTGEKKLKRETVIGSSLKLKKGKGGSALSQAKAGTTGTESTNRRRGDEKKTEVKRPRSNPGASESGRKEREGRRSKGAKGIRKRVKLFVEIASVAPPLRKGRAWRDEGEETGTRRGAATKGLDKPEFKRRNSVGETRLKWV